MWIKFVICHKFALFLFCLRQLKFGRSHITCQDVRHASWGSCECDLWRKCESSVKVCVTHLRVRRSEFVVCWVVDLDIWLHCQCKLECKIGMWSWDAEYAQAVSWPGSLPTGTSSSHPTSWEIHGERRASSSTRVSPFWESAAAGTGGTCGYGIRERRRTGYPSSWGRQQITGRQRGKRWWPIKVSQTKGPWTRP